MAKNLNKDAVYRAAKPKEKDYTINDGECLALLVKANGSKLWRFIYRFGGKQNRLGFGSNPETSLESARRKAEAAREQIANGIEPGAIRKQEKADNQQATDAQKRLDAGLPLINSFEYVTREWLASTAHTVRDITQQKKQRRFELYVFSAIGQMPIGDVKSPDVFAIVRSLIIWSGVCET